MQRHRRNLHVLASMLLMLSRLTVGDGDGDQERATIETLLRNKSTEEARSLIGPLIADSPNDARLKSYLALSYVHENRWESASRAYAEALRLEPSETEYRLLYGWSLYYLGQLGAARTQFEIFLQSHEDFVDAIFAVGLIEFDQDQMNEAEARFRRVIVLTRARQDDRRHSMARARMADIFLRRNNPSRARLELKRALELDPTNTKAQFKMSRVLQLLAQHEEAAAAHRRFETLRDSAAADEAQTKSPERP